MLAVASTALLGGMTAMGTATGTDAGTAKDMGRDALLAPTMPRLTADGDRDATRLLLWPFGDASRAALATGRVTMGDGAGLPIARGVRGCFAAVAAAVATAVAETAAAAAPTPPAPASSDDAAFADNVTAGMVLSSTTSGTMLMLS
jgi:hypothetical protein